MMWLNTDVILSSLENVDIVMGYVQLWKAWLLDKMPQDVLAACVGKSTKKFQSVVLAYHAIGDIVSLLMAPNSISNFSA
ncbi:uncharacterized protein LOC107822587 isoform X2 [Nicotiana tabacum]|uniref:Uncharacterized protein LOC107822587 isoform X2 n=10 Tax=Nicotiana tabacum TaxID=4097 RepID=A0AC58SZ48_TOBAC